jgi:hypothetical protein
MYYFARHIAAGKKFPSFAFSFKSLHATVLIRHLPVPECAKRTIRWAIYSISLGIIFADHDGAYLSPFSGSDLGG